MVAAFSGAVVLVMTAIPALASGPFPDQEPATATSAPATQSQHASTPKPHGEESEEPGVDGAGEPGDNNADDAGRQKQAHRHGPPSWAHAAHSKGSTGHGDSAWKKLSPAQRASTMIRLARSHTAGMKKWSTCATAGRNDCVKPLPPGLAKPR
jgi:hypothetical protein